MRAVWSRADGNFTQGRGANCARLQANRSGRSSAPSRVAPSIWPARAPRGRCTGSTPHAFAQRLARCLPGWIHDDGFDAGRPDIDAEEPGEGPVDQKKPRAAKAIVRLRWMNERNMSGSTI